MTEPLIDRKERYHTNTSIVFSDVEGTHRFKHGTLYNFNREGIYFESDDKLKPDSEIIVESCGYVPGPCGPEGADHYRAKVKWCKEIEDSDSYAVGAEISGK